jgi:biopolymer transport protein ExbD
MRVKKFDSINVVPFIDIMLVLLVIVLTTASFVAKGMIPIDLSEVKSAVKLKEQKELSITISKDAQVYFNDKKVLKDDILLFLKEYKTDTPISIACDREVKFDFFVYLLDVLKNNQYTNIGIVTKQK